MLQREVVNKARQLQLILLLAIIVPHIFVLYILFALFRWKQNSRKFTIMRFLAKEQVGYVIYNMFQDALFSRFTSPSNWVTYFSAVLFFTAVHSALLGVVKIRSTQQRSVVTR
jgi:chromate transport protein ChrA